MLCCQTCHKPMDILEALGKVKVVQGYPQCEDCGGDLEQMSVIIRDIELKQEVEKSSKRFTILVEPRPDVPYNCNWIIPKKVFDEALKVFMSQQHVVGYLDDYSYYTYDRNFDNAAFEVESIEFLSHEYVMNGLVFSSPNGLLLVDMLETTEEKDLECRLRIMVIKQEDNVVKDMKILSLGAFAKTNCSRIIGS